MRIAALKTQNAGTGGAGRAAGAADLPQPGELADAAEH
jgi:hypothetical protein